MTRVAQWEQLSRYTFWFALAAYTVSMLFGFYYLAFRREGVWKLANAIAWAGFAANLVSVVTRGIAAQRVPWGTMYEYSSLLALLVVAGEKFIVELRFKVKTVAPFALLFAVITMFIAGSFLYRDPGPLVPALDSAWLKIHVVAVIIASSLLSLGAGVLTPLYLVKARRERKAAIAAGTSPGDAPSAVVGSSASDEDPPYFEAGADEPAGAGTATAVMTRPGASEPPPPDSGPGAHAGSPPPSRGILPSSETLDRLAYRTIAIGFPIWTFAVIAGAIWAQRAWGRYWGWDPKEVWAFVTWAIFAGYLHARATVGWKGRRAAIIALVGFAAILMTYYWVNLVGAGLHTYSGVTS